MAMIGGTILSSVKKPAAMGRSTDPSFAVTISRQHADTLTGIIERFRDCEDQLAITSEDCDELIEALKQ